MSFAPLSASQYSAAFNGTAYATAANTCPCAVAPGANQNSNNAPTYSVNQVPGVYLAPNPTSTRGNAAAAPAATVVNTCTGETRTYHAPAQQAAPTHTTVCQTVQTQAAPPQYDDQTRNRKSRSACKRIVAPPTQAAPPCYTPCPRRCDCYPADPKEYNLLHLDAFDTDIDLGTCEDNLYNYFTDGCSFIANDGRVAVSGQGLSLIARQYTKTVPQCGNDQAAALAGSSGCPADGAPAVPDCADLKSTPAACRGPTRGPEGYLDHFKQVIYHHGALEVPDCGELYMEALATGSQNNAEVARGSGLYSVGGIQFVEQPRRDPRIAAFVPIMMTDLQSGTYLSLSWRFTDGAAWGFHEILPFGQEEFGGTNSTKTASFTAAYMLTTRNACRPMEDWARVGIGLDKSRGVAHFYHNGTRVLTIARLGHRPAPQYILADYGGESRDIAPRSMSLGFGHMNHMDGVSPFKSVEHRDTEVGLVELLPQALSGQKNSYESDDTLGQSQLKYVYSPTASIINTPNAPPRCSTPCARLAGGVGSTGIIREVKAVHRC